MLSPGLIVGRDGCPGVRRREGPSATNRRRVAMQLDSIGGNERLCHSQSLSYNSVTRVQASGPNLKSEPSCDVSSDMDWFPSFSMIRLDV